VRFPLVAVQVVGGVSLLAIPFLHAYSAPLLMMFLVGIAYGTVTVITAKAIFEWFPRTLRATALGVRLCALPVAGSFAGLVVPGVALWGAGARLSPSLEVSCWLQRAVISSCIATVRRRHRPLPLCPLPPPGAPSCVTGTSGCWQPPGSCLAASDIVRQRIWRCSCMRDGGCRSLRPPVCWRRPTWPVYPAIFSMGW
jgi:hypothetical protein